MTLSQVENGGKVLITSIEGGRGLREKLHLRGIYEGKMVRVISNKGPLTVEVDRSVVALGRGMAHKIAVSRC